MGLPLWILIRLFLVKIQSSMIVSRYVSNTNLDYYTHYLQAFAHNLKIKNHKVDILKFRE